MNPDDFTVDASTIREMREQLEFARVHMFRPVTLGSLEDAPNVDITSNKKNRMKERHLSQEERRMYHNPETDWCETKRGEKCHNAASLEVADIVGKYQTA